jgi:hypothetical protein
MWSRRSSPAAMVSAPAHWMRRGPSPARGGPESDRRDCGRARRSLDPPARTPSPARPGLAERPDPPSARCSDPPNATEQAPSATNPAIMIPGSRASGAARPLSWTATAECPVWRREATSHAPVNATGPTIPVAAPSLDDNAGGPAVRTVAASLDGTAEGPATGAAASRDEEGMRMADSVTYGTPGRRAARLARGGGAGRTERAGPSRHRGRPYGAGTGAGREAATEITPAQKGGPG